MEKIQDIDRLRTHLQKKIVRAEAKVRYYSHDLWSYREAWNRLGFSDITFAAPKATKKIEQLEMFG